MGTKISGLGAFTTIAAGDLFGIVDVSDTTQAASGSTKKMTFANLQAGVLGAIDAVYTLNVGALAGSSSDAEFSVHIGYGAGANTPTAGQAVCVGYLAGDDPGGYAGTFIGYTAGQQGGGTSAVAVGYAVMKTADTSGVGNIAIGVHAAEVITTMSGTIVMGYHALNGATTSTNSVVIGDHAGGGVANANNCIFIGPYMGVSRNNTLHIGISGSIGGTAPLIYGEFDNDYAKINGHLETTEGVKFPTADPHIAGYWWDNAGVLTKSAG